MKFTLYIRNFVLSYLAVALPVGVMLCLFTACGTSPKQETTSLTKSKTIQAFHHKKLQSIYSTHEYAWDSLEQGVPPLILNKLPNDLHLIQSSKQKKALFFKTLLPMAMLANEEIMDQRRSLNTIFTDFDHNGKLTPLQYEKLSSLQKRYRVKSDPLSNRKTRELLLSRVDIVPESLILAQAANESGWGTSRFVREANNIFGQWTFTPGTGLVPEGRPEGETYEVRRFSNLYQSVRSYLRNINTHRAYSDLRQTRLKLRQANQPVTGIALSANLSNYSTRREAYSREIEAMIRSNQLEQIIASTYLRSDASIPGTETITPSTGLLSSKELLQKRTGTL